MRMMKNRNKDKMKYVFEWLFVMLLWLSVPVATKASTGEIDQLTKRMYQLYPDGKKAEKFMRVTDSLRVAAEKAGDEDLFWRTWSNQATYASKNISREKALDITHAMSDYARQHDSKLGLYISTYTNAVLASNQRMERQAEELLLQALDYKKRFLPGVNSAPDYLALVKIYINRSEKAKALEFTRKALEDPNIIPAQRVSAWCYMCLAAALENPKDGTANAVNTQITKEFNGYYAELQKVLKETGLTNGQVPLVDVYHAKLNGNYSLMLELAKKLPSRIDSLSMTAQAYSWLGRGADAYATYVKYKKYSDSINNETVRQLTSNHSLALDVARAENEAKDLRIANQESRERVHHIIMATVGVIALLVIAFLALFLHRRNKHAKEIEKAYGQLEDAHQRLEDAYGRLEETTKAKERMESELRIARDIQMGMVPSIFPAFPHREDVDIFASLESAKEVGGDLYDFFLQNDKLYFCIGDVAGKGIPASLFMSVVVNVFRMVAKEGFPPAYIATKLNDALSTENDNGMFVTMFIGEIDLRTGSMDFCNAGHNPILIIDRPLSPHQPCRPSYIEMEPNAPIGLWQDLEFVGERIANVRGRTMFLYTDGLTEAENLSQDQFGEDRLIRLFETRPYDSARQTVDMVKAAVIAFVGEAEPSDDLTMLCLKIK